MRIAALVILVGCIAAIGAFAAQIESPDDDLFSGIEGEPLTAEEAEEIEGDGFFSWLFARKGKYKKQPNPNKREKEGGAGSGGGGRGNKTKKKGNET